MSFLNGRFARVVCSVLLFVAVPLFLYWMFFMSRRLEHWQRTNVAVLGTMASALEDRVASEQRIAENLDRSATLYLRSLARGDVAAAGNEPAEARKVRTRIDGREASLLFPRDGGTDWRVEFARLGDALWLETDFDAIVVADLEGKVFYEVRDGRPVEQAVGSTLAISDGAGRATDVARLLRVEAPPDEQDPAAAPASGSEGEDDADDEPIARNQGSWLRNRLLGIADMPRVRVDADEHLVYARSVRLPEAGGEIAVLGLVQTTRLMRHAVRLSPIALTWVFAIVAAAFLAMPYLKIRFLGSCEPLRAIDMWLLAASALLGTGLATLLVCQISSLARLRSSMDATLQTFARDVSRQVDDEIQWAYRQLEESAPALARSEPRAYGSILAGRERFGHYPHFEALLFTDDQKQVRKWMPEPVPTPMVSVDDQPWFAAANALQPGGPAFVVHSIVAKNSAKDLAVIATPARLAPQPELGPNVPVERRTGVAAVATPMLSLRAPVTPRGFEFVVIDGEGHVAFRSGTARNARESFFDAIDGGPRLRELAASAGLQPFETPSLPQDFRYRGRMHRGTVLPLPDASMLLIAYYDKTLVESPAGRVFAIGLAWLALLTVACLAAAGITRLLHAGAADWAWPSARHHGLYLLGCAVFAGLGALLFWIGWARPGRWSPYLLIGVPVATIVTLMLLPIDRIADLLQRNGENPAGWIAPRRLYPHSYVLSGTAALFALIAVPVAVVHLDSFRAHRAAIQILTARHHDRALAERTRRLGEHYVVARDLPCRTRSSVACSVVAATQAARTRLVDPPFGVYCSALTGCAAMAAGPAVEKPPACGSLFALDFERLPQRFFSNALMPCLRWLGSEPSVGEDALIAADASDIAVPNTSLARASVLSRTLLPILGVFLLLGFFVQSVSRRILGLQLEGDGVVDRSREIDRLGRALLLRPTAERLAEVTEQLKAQSGALFDLSDPEVSLDTASASPVHAPLLLAAIEARLEAPTERGKLLAILEKPRQDGRLLLVASIDPLYFLGTRLAQANAQPLDCGELQRWARALDGFERIRFARPSRKASDPAVKIRRRTLTRLRRECEWDDRLLEIESHLLARPDLDRFGWEQIVDYVHDAAEAHYEFLWSLCSMEERCVLRQLAVQGFVNPHFFDVLRRLRRRRLVRIDPRFRLACESFERFVREARVSSEELAWREKEPQTQSSHRIWVPTLVLGGLAAAVLALTQAEFMDTALGTFATVGVALTSVGTLAARFRALAGTATG